MEVQALNRHLNPFRCTQLGSPTQVYRNLGGNLLFLLTSPLLLSHALQFPAQLVACNEWGSCTLLSEWPQELSTSSETTSTMTAPPPFLLLFKIEYVRIINISAVKTLGIHTGFRCSWEGLKAMVSGFRKPGPRCQLCPSGWSSSFFGAGSSFGLLSYKMDIILYPSLLMLRIKNASANRLHETHCTLWELQWTAEQSRAASEDLGYIFATLD